MANPPLSGIVHALTVPRRLRISMPMKLYQLIESHCKTNAYAWWESVDVGVQGSLSNRTRSVHRAAIRVKLSAGHELPTPLVPNPGLTFQASVGLCHPYEYYYWGSCWRLLAILLSSHIYWSSACWKALSVQHYWATSFGSSSCLFDSFPGCRPATVIPSKGFHPRLGVHLLPEGVRLLRGGVRLKGSMRIRINTRDKHGRPPLLHFHNNFSASVGQPVSVALPEQRKTGMNPTVCHLDDNHWQEVVYSEAAIRADEGHP